MRRWVAVAWLLGLVVIVGCSGGGGQPAAPKQAGIGGDPGVVHVHGLGINPKDGALFAATHTGLFRIPDEGQAERIADRYQDTMGFTVVGPDRFLGSGHPDLREAQAKRLPPLLGLIESKDAGQTWQPRSLAGQSDFHALRAAHG
ncbi:MAG: exo-alpha-sialidase, partial [Chloroflexota bacterium]|nr:exo-alpha-sialidase [Chloroflexota bacterium]